MTAIPPGWYPDPKPGVQGMRWWDGERWTSHVTPHAPATAQLRPAKRGRLRRLAGGVRWTAIGTFVIVAGAVAYGAVTRGIASVDVDDAQINFLGKHVDGAEAARASDGLERRVQQLEDEARQNATATAPPAQGATVNGQAGTNQPPPAPATATAAATPDLTGDWRGDDGYVYRVDQFGRDVIMQGFDPRYPGIVAGVAEGTITGNRVQMRFQNADGSIGRVDLRYNPDRGRMAGTYVNDTYGVRAPLGLSRTSS
jgi:hypothetical protein